jgi:hypothetical protein
MIFFELSALGHPYFLKQLPDIRDEAGWAWELGQHTLQVIPYLVAVCIH